MSDILTTKLHIPRVRPNLVLRPRLTKRLTAEMERKLTLITAPTGFGKTILLSEWIPQSERCVTWVSLDEGDNDPARFWVYFIAALQMLNADIGKNALALIQSLQPPRIESFLTLLLNEIAEFPEYFALVLDNYQAIRAQPIHTGIKFLIEHLPDHMHLVISTRIDPPIALGSLRAGDQLNEIRTDDLRFTLEESVVFFKQCMGLNLSVEQVQSLETRTEGWIAGLQIAALSMKSHDDITSFIEGFSGNHRHILGYLTEEVLSQRSKDTLNFLLKTSILDRLCGPLCDAVTGGTDGQTTLAQLEQDNLFIIPLDDDGVWYRYHPIFADLLRHRLSYTYPDQVVSLHLTASQWYEQAGLTRLAVQHALEAKAFDRAAALVEQIAPAMIQSSEIAGLLTWIGSLPDDEIQARPRLALYHGWGLLLSGKFKQAAARLEAIESMLSTDEAKRTPEVRGHTAAMRARLVRESGDLATSITLSREGLAQVPEQETLLRARITLDLSIAHYLQGEFEPASQLLTKTIAKGPTAQHLLSILSSIYLNTQILRAQGALGEALQLCQEELELVAKGGWQNFPAVGFLFVSLGELLRERNELTAASEFLERGIKLGQEGANPFVSIAGNVWLAWLRQTQGDAPGSHKAIRSALQVVEQQQVSRFWPLPPAACYQARLWIAQGNLVAAERWAQTSGLTQTDCPISFLYEVDTLTLARLLIAQGNLNAADSLLLRLQRAAVSARRNGSLVEILCLQAINYAAQKHSKEAFSALAQALGLAEPEGFKRIFLDEGEPMRKVIHDWRSETGRRKDLSKVQTRLMDYADQLGAAFSADLPPSPILTTQTNSAAHQVTLVEALSDRELEVLQLIAEGLSNLAVAQKLYLSTGTVKVHLKHIYGKLNVNSRTQAAARLRELNLP